MRRVATLLFLLLCSLPFGISLAGCGGSGTSSQYCNGSSGPLIGQAQNITLQPQIGGISLNFAQSTNINTPTATDCKGNAVSISRYTYAAPAAQAAGVLDINPSNGSLCAGVWNRNSPGGTPDFSTCSSTGKSGIAELTASGGGAASNKIFVYIHPVVTSIEIGTRNPAFGCDVDPATDCPGYTASIPPATNVGIYNPNDCISFGQSAQLVLRFYQGPKSATLPDPNNITFVAGHATLNATTPSLVTFNNDNGVVTATAPGSTVVTASLGPGGTTTSNAGFIAVCAPRSIVINTPNAVNGTVSINANNTEALTATAIDTKGVQISGLNLTYTSTSPIATPASSIGITPAFAGGAAINAICLPPTCNPAPLEEVGRYPNGTPAQNGKPVASNTIVTNTPGTTSSLIWVSSTDSQYLLPIDLTTNTVSTPTRLPYPPTSMVLTQDGTSIFLGSNSGLMTFATGSNGVTRIDQSIQGLVLSPSPNSLQVVATDPQRQLVYIYQPNSGTVINSFHGVGTRAAWSTDGQTAYIVTADNHLLVYSSSTSWHSYDLSSAGALNDVTGAVPAVGAFIGASTTINARSYCPNTTTAVTDYFPQAGSLTASAAIGDRLAATNDGKHLLDVRLATANGTPVLNDLLLGNGAGLPTQECPENGSTPSFTATTNTVVVTGLQAGAVTGIFPASDSSIAFITNTAATGAPSTGAVIAAYRPATTGAGTISNVPLASGATAAISGAISTDNKTFFAGTSGDNLLHFINVTTLADASQINPRLPSLSNPSGTAVPNLIVARPRAATATGQ